MLARLPRLSFRAKVMVLAVFLVVIQLGAMVPILHTIRGALTKDVEETLNLAGKTFEQYMQNRNASLVRVANVIAADWPLRQAVANEVIDVEPGAPVSEAVRFEIGEVLSNLAGRDSDEFADAAIFDLNGRYLGGIEAAEDLRNGQVHAHFAGDPATTEAFHDIQLIDGMAYQTVSVPLRLQLSEAEASGWLTLGFPVNEPFAGDVAGLTGHEATFLLRFGLGRTRVFGSTLEEVSRDLAVGDVLRGDNMGSGDLEWGEHFITLKKAVLTEEDGLYVAIQRSVPAAMQSYMTLRNVLLLVTGIALLATIAAALWLSRVVTRPIVTLVEAARRMAEGIYSQPIKIKTEDEFGVLAQGFNSMQEAISNRERDIVHMAHHDSLSGLPTREIVVGEIRDALGENDQLAIINFVLHSFDELASSLGHRTADRLIQLVAGRLRDQLEEHEILGHLNHPEFVLVLPGAGLDEAEEYALELQQKLRSGFAVGDANISLQIRAGISLYPEHGVNSSELLRCAGIARGHSSQQLGEISVYKVGQEEKSLELIQIVGDFPRALQNRELWVEYQPKIDCETLEVTGAEALVRWDHPTLGRLSPDVFIGAIERAGGISQLTRWVLEEAAATLSGWRAQGREFSVAVNVSAHDLVDDFLPRHIRMLCDRYGIKAEWLTIEITESAIMHDVEGSMTIVEMIRKLGCKIAIDDFGTGHSALAQLKRLPVDELKIDKSFVLNIEDKRDEAVVRTAIELAHQFGLTVVAEGVENQASLNRLQQLECESAQGFYFSRSMEPGDFVAWARAWSRGEGADIVTLTKGREHSGRA